MLTYLITLILITLSACFSGLTLAFFTLHTSSLRRKAKLGNEEAKLILPIRKQGNRLLTTLLLANVAVNAILSVYLSQLASGIMAALMATALIFIFGEILPQAVFSRYALTVGAKATPYIKFLMWLFFPITWPIATLLDRLLGAEMQTIYSKRELMEIVSELEDSSHSNIDADEERIVHGALQFSHTKVRDVMTPKSQVISLEENMRLDHELIDTLMEHSFSRYPVYSGNQDNIVGILFVKDLIAETDDRMIKDMSEAFDTRLLSVTPGDMLDVVLAKMLKQRQHLGIVRTRNGQYVGVISLEDIIEEIIQLEIEDETDHP